MGRGITDNKPIEPGWREVRPGLWQSTGLPCSYALIEDEAALIIDAALGADLEALKKRAAKVELVLLTHHHRDSCANAEQWFNTGIYIQAPKTSAEWVTVPNVAKFWQESLPLRNSRTAYLVVPHGMEGIDCTLEDGQKIHWRGWTIQAVATPGHSRDHMAYAARKASGPLILFCGDALASPGKMWSPYTTDWDHWTDAGLKPAAESLHKLARMQPAMVCPAHGAPITANAAAELDKTAEVVEANGFLRSYDRFSKERLGNPPSYAFLAKEQAGTAGEKPWSQLSEHLLYTGNTYVLVSKDNALMVFDPWGKRSADQIQKLRTERSLGSIELVMFSHAHYDHYDGIYELPDRDKFQVWSLDTVARPIGEPFFYRAPFLDARPVRFERRLKDGESAAWREYSFRFRHFPGQSYFTMAVETVIDGKKCVFTGDNFFHIDLYSGTGGWMGLNRSWPGYYAASARRLLELRPDWVLAEHGGAFEFNEEDIRRRVRWGEEAAKAADNLSPSGNHRHDWDPHRIHIEPLVALAKPGETVQLELVATNPLDRPEKLQFRLPGRGVVADWEGALSVSAGGTEREKLAFTVDAKAAAGRHVLPLQVREGAIEDPVDAFLVIDVKR
jgi:glyoxylase-like metal-dependent hydrolase (beta-lactamase superfamily II)